MAYLCLPESRHVPVVVASTERLMPASARRRPRSDRPGDAVTAAFANAWGMPVIEVAGLRKQYGSKVAVDDVSFTVEAGEIFGILGPNGAGKTTTVECAIGLRTPDSGSIRVLGLDPAKDREELHLAVGVQLQSSVLPSRLDRVITVMFRSLGTGRSCCLREKASN